MKVSELAKHLIDFLAENEDVDVLTVDGTGALCHISVGNTTDISNRLLNVVIDAIDDYGLVNTDLATPAEEEQEIMAYFVIIFSFDGLCLSREVEVDLNGTDPRIYRMEAKRRAIQMILRDDTTATPEDLVWEKTYGPYQKD